MNGFRLRVVIDQIVGINDSVAILIHIGLDVVNFTVGILVGTRIKAIELAVALNDFTVGIVAMLVGVEREHRVTNLMYLNGVAHAPINASDAYSLRSRIHYAGKLVNPVAVNCTVDAEF